MFNAAHVSPTSRIGVVVIHRDALVRAGLLSALSQDEAYRVVDGVAGTAASGLPRLPDDASGRPPVILADYDSALTLLSTHRHDGAGMAGRPPRIMVVTHRDRESDIRHALEQGVQGYLMAGCSLQDLHEGVRSLHGEIRFISARAAQRLAESLSHPALTARESSVLQHLCSGSSNKSIARALDIALGTVKAHVRAILDKLGASTRTEAAAIARTRGLCGTGVDAGDASGHSSETLRGNA